MAVFAVTVVVLAREVHSGLALLCAAVLAVGLGALTGSVDAAQAAALSPRLLRFFDAGLLTAVPLVFLAAELVVAGTPAQPTAAPLSGAPLFKDWTTLVAWLAPIPALVLILADRAGDALQDAQVAQGVFGSDAISIRQLAAGMMIAATGAGLLLAGWRMLDAGRIGRKDYLRLPDLGTGANILPGLALVVAVGLEVATPVEAAGMAVVGAALLAGLRAGVRPVVTLGALAASLLLVAIKLVADLRLTRVVIPAGDRIAIVLAGLCLAGIAVSVAMVSLRLAKAPWLDTVLKSAAARSADLFLIVAGAAATLLLWDIIGGRAFLAAAATRLPAPIAWGVALVAGAGLGAVAGWRLPVILLVPALGGAVLSGRMPARPAAAILFAVLLLLAALFGMALARFLGGDRAAVRLLAATPAAGALLLIAAWLLPAAVGG